MECEPVVMLGREDDVLAARLFGQPRPFPGEARLRLEQRDGALGIRLRIGLHALLNPFHSAPGCDWLTVPSSGKTRVQTPVDEHSEACLAPPLHAGIALGRRFGPDLARGNQEDN
jgi:hypothetical protein